ncbi:MAG: ornithine aminomutase subunit alpha [Negativicutes bacterium]|jgi:D-ornithine 4,5-aminomutase subunit alpha
MQRNDDFTKRRTILGALTDEQLKNRFWELAETIVAPMIAVAKSHTSPSIERSVLMRMGFSSAESKEIVNRCLEHNLLGKGAGHCILKLAELRNCDYSAAGALLAVGDGWTELQAVWRKGNN